MATPTDHAELGASGAHRWRNCAGSINASRGLPDETSFYAAEGTVAHRVGELCLDNDWEPQKFHGVEKEQDGFVITIDEEMTDAVQVFVDHVQERAAGEDKLLYLEQSFDLNPLNPPGPMYGTADVVVWDEEVAHLDVIDYKHGAGVTVDAINNDQGLTYSLGATVKMILEFKHKPKTIRFTIVQPRGHHEDGVIRSWDFTYDELIEMKQGLFEDAAKTLDPHAPLAAGSWCRFCKAKPTCPEQRKSVELLAQDAFAVEPVFPEVERLTVDDLAEVLAASSQITSWLKDVQAHCLNAAQNGTVIPGYKLVEKKTNRKWVDPKKAEKYLAGRRLKQDERFKRTVISPAQAEKILKKADGPDLPDRLWEKPEGGKALAPLDDKRPELASGVQEAFGVLPPATE